MKAAPKAAVLPITLPGNQGVATSNSQQVAAAAANGNRKMTASEQPKQKRESATRQILSRRYPPGKTAYQIAVLMAQAARLAVGPANRRHDELDCVAGARVVV